MWRPISVARLPLLLLLPLLLPLSPAAAYHRAPCTTNSVRRQFQYSECYAPSMLPSLPLSEASFLMAHDAATGYLPEPSQRELDEAAKSFDRSASTNSLDHKYSHRWSAISKQLLALYGKSQRGTAYDQLNDGARALDLRPKLYVNGTVGFHRGSLVDVPLSRVTLGQLLEDAKKWCRDNPKELVLLFHGQLVHEAGYNGLVSKVYMEADDDAYNIMDHRSGDDYADDANDNHQEEEGGDYLEYNYNYQPYDYQDDTTLYVYDDESQLNYASSSSSSSSGYSYFYSGIAKMKEVYDKHAVPYYPCTKLGGLTVAQTMELADLSALGGKGYLLAVDRHDMYASFCGKTNRVQNQLVTCYSSHSVSNDNNINSYYENPSASYLQCTDLKSTGQSKLNALQSYVKASANNDPTDNSNELGPPYDKYNYPFNQIQGFWQVDATSVIAGLLRSSTLLKDNEDSQVNAEMVKMIYHGELSSVGLFSMDNVALNGNAMFSVLRNACGQSANNDTCGADLIMPQMHTSSVLPVIWNVVLFVVYGALALMVLVMLIQAFLLRRKEVREAGVYGGAPLVSCSGSVLS